MSTDPALVKSIFLEIVTLDEPAARAARLSERCGNDDDLRARVNALLAANDLAVRNEGTATFSQDPVAGTADFPGRDEHVGAILAGKYKLIEEIGEGGMGSVYMAQQTEPVKRAVAVKVIKAGMDSKAVLARFDAERQALAMMDHPNIARVLDAGTTESGRPFFVMELVKGVPITQYCDEQKFTPRQRLELFVPVCNAVQHAHQKGIIHRDIKPSNVLVALYDDRPVPKVIDFGVAKATGPSLTDKTLMTGFGAVVGTPEYMSPEQATLNNLDIDTRSDVYSLGVLLYELLTGTTPVDRMTLGKAALLEILRIVREVEAPKPSDKLSTIDTLPNVAANRGTDPSKLSKLMKGELDWVVLKALEKDRTRRYDTANGLARDIQRYLADEVVEARPPSTSYRFKKFVKRHRGQVIAASLVLFVLLAGMTGTTWGLFEAKRQEQIALSEVKKKEEARKKTREALDTLTSDALEGWFTRERNLAPEQKDVLRRLLDQYAAFAEESGDAPEARRGQVRALMRVGKIQQALGDRLAAGQTLGRAAELAGTMAAPITNDPDGWKLVAETHTTLFTFFLNGRLFREAEPHEREAQAARIRMLAADPTQHRLRFLIAAGRMNLAATLGDQNRLDEADAEHRAAVAELEELVRDYPGVMQYFANLATELNNRAILAQKQLRIADALAFNARAIEMRRKHLQLAPRQAVPMEDLVKALDVGTEILIALDRSAEAETMIREAITIVSQLTEAFPSIPRYRVLQAGEYAALSTVFMAQGHRPAAVEEARRAVAIARSVTDEFPEDLPPGLALVAALTRLSWVLLDTQSVPEAESASRAALAESDRLARAFGKRSDLAWRRAEAVRSLGNVLNHQARLTEEEAVQREFIATLADIVRDNPELVAWTALTTAHFDLAGTLIRRGETTVAEAELRAAAANLDRLPVTDREKFRSVYFFEMAKLTVGAGRWAEGDEWASRATEAFAKRYKEDPRLDQNRAYLVQCYWHRATARDHLDRHADAAADWGAAADLADIPMDKAFYRAHRGASIYRGGDTTAASAEFASAIQQAETALKMTKPVGTAFYDAAAVYALVAGGSKDPALIESHGAEAVRLLGRAAGTGYLNDPAQVETLRVADEYTTLHERDDFKKLLTELQKKLPPKTETLPLPRKK